MRNATIAVLTVALAVLVGGCSGGSSGKPKEDKGEQSTGGTHDAVMTEMTGLMNEYADILAKAKDKASAEKAKDDLKALGDKFQSVGERAKKLGEPGKDQQEALMKKHMPEMEKAQKRIMEASVEMSKHPEAAKVLAPAMQELSKKMQAMPK